jgi:quercetin dioxygenase-like cupin family protein
MSTTMVATWIVEDEYQMEWGDARSIERTGQTLCVLSGCAWITVDGLDLIVLAGEKIVLEPGIDPAVISALESQPLVYRLIDHA